MGLSENISALFIYFSCLLLHAEFFLGMSKGVRKQGNRNKNCNDRFCSSHFCAPAFDMFILSDSESCLLFKPLWPLWPYHMPLTGGKPRLAGYSQSPHMLRGGTKRETNANSLARILLCKGACFTSADCFAVPARSGVWLMMPPCLYPQLEALMWCLIHLSKGIVYFSCSSFVFLLCVQ